MENYELKPMGVGDIFDATFRLFRGRFVTYLLIALVVYLPYAVLVASLQSSITEDMATGQMSPESTAPLIVNGVLLFLFTFVAMPLCTGALVHNISASYLGEELSATESYRRALPRILLLLGANILVGIVVFIGFLLLIVPGVIFSLWFMVVTPVVMLEAAGPTKAMGRSRDLMKGNLGKGFMIAIVLFLIGVIFEILAQLLVELIPLSQLWLSSFLASLAEALVLPIQTAPMVLLYYDLRIRKEAFDLDRLAESLDQAVPEGGAGLTEQ